MGLNRRVHRVAGGVVVAAGAALMLIRFFGEVPPAQTLEAAIGAIAFGSAIAAPGILSLLARRDRPALLLPASVALVLLSFLSVVTLPLLIPAFMLLHAGARVIPEGRGWRAAATTSVVVALVTAAVVVLFLHDDPRQYRTASGFYATSDVVTYLEATLSASFTVAAVVAGWSLTPAGTDG